MRNTCPCTICGTNSEGENGIKINKIISQNNQYRRVDSNDKSFNLCNKCLLNRTREFTDHTSCEKIKIFVKCNLLIEDSIYEGIEDHLELNNVRPIRSNSTNVDRDPMLIKFKKAEDLCCNNRFDTAINEASGTNVKTLKSRTNGKSELLNKIFTPSEIHKKLNETVIGQDKALKSVSVHVFRHLQSLRNNNVKKSNLLLIGESGVGKTETVQAIAEALGLPFMSFNCGNLTPSGYKGDNISSFAEKIITAFGQEKASTCILYLDEIDKINANSEKDEFGARVQHELLKILDGDTLVSQSHRGEPLALSFKNILIVASGAFPSLKNLKKPKKKMGMNSTNTEENIEVQNRDVTNSDLFKMGFGNEFIGRFSSVVELKELNEDEMVDILRKSKKSVLKDYESLFKEIKSEIVFEDNFLREVVRDTVGQNTGNRGVKRVLDQKMEDILYAIEAYMDGTLYMKSKEEGSEFFVLHSYEATA